MFKDITLEFFLLGSVYDVKIFIDGKEIGLWYFDPSRKMYIRELKRFEVAFKKVEIRVETRGENDSTVTLQVNYGTTKMAMVACENKDGVGSETIVIPRLEP